MSEFKQIRTVGVVGTGLMGSGIAEVCAVSGYKTIVVKATPGCHHIAQAKVEKSLARSVEKGKLTPEQRDAALANMEWTGHREALGGADLVIESVPEDMATKRSLFHSLHGIVPAETIFASNTSTLRISEMAHGIGREDRTIGLHFFSPVPAMKLVELAHLHTTAPDVLKAAMTFVGALGKTAVPVLDSTGFVVNRLLVPYLIGAISAYEQGLAKPEEIDLAMKLGCGHPMGPLALSDLIGLDIVYAMSKLLHADFQDARYQPPSLLRRLVQDGQLGKKSGIGFYDYRDGEPKANEAILELVRAGMFARAGATVGHAA
jgi:3-hydroxybutyryl-CoA dehydrogenase